MRAVLKTKCNCIRADVELPNPPPPTYSVAIADINMYAGIRDQGKVPSACTIPINVRTFRLVDRSYNLAYYEEV